ncbi:CYP102A5 [Symbiodinium natans]|uniref:CYP102A5 protein n=1 Tax=Symbiodinium natans TaxID=878477 RepID=A0A812T2H4_9DINO|nr:CYP102A5 [Symbiodinium natans]
MMCAGYREEEEYWQAKRRRERVKEEEASAALPEEDSSGSDCSAEWGSAEWRSAEGCKASPKLMLILNEVESLGTFYAWWFPWKSKATSAVKTGCQFMVLPASGTCTKFIQHMPVGTKDDTTPMVMVGLGTGIAPIRSFMQDKLYKKNRGIKTGPMVVFYGCRHEKGGYFFMCGPAVATPSVQKALKVGSSTFDIPIDLPRAPAQAEKDMWPTPKTDAEAELWFKDFQAAGRYSEVDSVASRRRFLDDAPANVRAVFCRTCCAVLGWRTWLLGYGPTCSGVEYPKHHKICGDPWQCTGQVCLSCGWGPDQTNVAACCDKEQMPKPNAKGRYPCERQSIVKANGTFCKFGCCTTGSTVCGDGCCRPGDHGFPHKCGRTLKGPRQGKGGMPCCVVEGASASEQEQRGCCIRGQGLNCLQNETPCCLWVQGDEHHTADPDPHSPCQPRNCSLYQPCPHGEGYDCTSYGQRICCLRPGGNISVSAADPCQRTSQDCKARWQQCAHGVGSDCAKNNQEACCLALTFAASDPCQKDCSQYQPPPKKTLWPAWAWAALAGGALAVVSVCLLAWCCWKKRRPPPSHESGNPPALVLYNSTYAEEFEPLPWARKDGEEMALMLDKLGYHAIDCHNVTCEVAKQLTERLLGELATCRVKDPVVPIYFAGHGVEVGNSQFLVPSNACSQDAELISLDYILNRAAEIHHRSRDAADAVKPLFLLILDTCRSSPRDEEIRKRLAAKTAGEPRRARRTRQLHKPEFAIIHACECGGVAQQCPATNHGYLTKAFIKHGYREQLSLSELLDAVQQQVVEETLEMYEQTKACAVQRPEHKSTAAYLASRYLSCRTDQLSRSRSTSASCIDVSSLSSLSSRDAPSLMRNAASARAALLTDADPIC